MPRYYVTIPVAFSLSVEVESDEELTCTKEAHRLAIERLGKDDGFMRLKILDGAGKECEIAHIGEEVEMPERLVSGMCLHVSVNETDFEPAD